MVEKFTNQLRDEAWASFVMRFFGAALGRELMKKAREADVETCKKHRACEKGPLGEC